MEYTPLPDHVVFIAVVFYVLDVAWCLTSGTVTRVVEMRGSGAEGVNFLRSYVTKVSVLLILVGNFKIGKSDREEDLQVLRTTKLEDRRKGNRELERQLFRPVNGRSRSLW